MASLRGIGDMRQLAKVSVLALWLLPTASEARDEGHWQRQYCAGMEIEHHLSSGGYVDCLNGRYAIEVDWSSKWAESVGQALYYASATDRTPGIVLLCESSEESAEGSCLSDVYRLEYALKSVSTHVQVWTCAIDEDQTLNDCFQPELQRTVGGRG